MAEPLYPSVEDQGGQRPLGFDVVAEPAGEPKSYTVEFTSSDKGMAEEPRSTEGSGRSEEIKLLERKSSTPEDKKSKEQTMFFDDGVRRIDFILTYLNEVEHKEKGKEDTEERRKKRVKKRDKFLASCREMGLELELQDCSESPDRKTNYLKVHGTHMALLRGADEMLLRMPIRENNLERSTFRERMFDCLKVRDPFEPVVPQHLEIDNYFTAPFKFERKENYIGWDDEKNFFSTAQRSAIVSFLMQEAKYGDQDDQIGLLRLLQNKTFSDSFPLHDGSYKVEKGEEIQTDRQFLYKRWSYWTNWYKSQPVDHIRRYFGEKIGIYFTWLGFYTTWLLPASIVGLIVMIYGLTTVVNPIADDICNDNLRYDFYMCPRCDTRCDFWYLRGSCAFSRLSLMFDSGATVFFAIFMAFWAVLFLEFWKRSQYYLQYDWDMLGYEDAEERARPEFEQKIKRYIRRCKKESDKEKFYVYNPVLEKREYIQPAHWFYPKAVATFSVLISMILVVLAVVFLVLLYRLGVAGLIYRLVSNIPGGPSVGDIVVSISGALIQLVAILILNRLYEFFATKLTGWELHRTQTEYDDSFITKMYLFQCVNFYTSLFYIAYLKGNLTGAPGGYQRIGPLRLDECATYGCLLELTIQLAIIFVGKQILNNCQEIALPYVKRLVKCLKHKEETEEDVYTRWEKDFDLIPCPGLFYEYLELVIQYGFATIFVAAFPLAPFFALLNNWVEIRLDAHKFVAVFRRPVAERAQDIGAWYTILEIVSKTAVVTNAFIIAITAQFIPIEAYRYGFRPAGEMGLNGYVNWSLSPFYIDALLDGEAFPSVSAQRLGLFELDGTALEAPDPDGSDLLFLPYVDIDCLTMNGVSDTYTTDGQTRDRFFDVPNITLIRPETGLPLTITRAFSRNSWINFYTNTTTLENIEQLLYMIPTDDYQDRSPSANTTGPCFLMESFQCRYRGLQEQGRAADGSLEVIFGLKYWTIWVGRLAFVIIFEHIIFVISAVLAYLVPDVPQHVKNEIQREKLLAYEAIHARQEAGKDLGIEPVDDDDEGGLLP